MERGRRFASLSAFGGALAALVVDGLYLAAIAQQGVTPPGGRVPFVAVWIAVAALLAAAGSLTWDPSARALVLGISTAALVVLGGVGVWSVGSPLLLCAGLVGHGALRAAEMLDLPWQTLLLAPLAMLALAGAGLYLGFTLTQG
jgi:hypothetical protein